MSHQHIRIENLKSQMRVREKNLKLDTKAPFFNSLPSENINDWIEDISIYLDMVGIPEKLKHLVVAGCPVNTTYQSYPGRVSGMSR